MLVFLSAMVIKGRWRTKVALGDGDDLPLQRAIRAHANFVEYTPLFLLLTVLAEYQGLAFYAVHILGGAFLVGRILHAYSLLTHERYAEGKLMAYPVWRTCGIVCTFTPITAISIILMIQFFV